MISRMPYLQGIGLNVRLIAVTCVLCVISAMVFTLTPVLRLSAAERFAGLKEATRGSAGTTWRRFGSYLVAAELAITVILLVNAGLLGKSFYRLLHVDPGFNVRRLALVGVSPVSVQPVSILPGSRDARAEQPRRARPPDRSPRRGPAGRRGGWLRRFGIRWVPAWRHRQGSESWAAPTRVCSMATPCGESAPATSRRSRPRSCAAATSRKKRWRRSVPSSSSTRPRRCGISRTTDPLGHSIAFGVPSDMSPNRRDRRGGCRYQGRSAGHAGNARSVHSVRSDRLRPRCCTSQAEQSILPSLVSAIRQVRPGLVVEGETTMTERMNRLPSCVAPSCHGLAGRHLCDAGASAQRRGTLRRRRVYGWPADAGNRRADGAGRATSIRVPARRGRGRRTGECGDRAWIDLCRRRSDVDAAPAVRRSVVGRAYPGHRRRNAHRVGLAGQLSSRTACRVG